MNVTHSPRIVSETTTSSVIHRKKLLQYLGVSNEGNDDSADEDIPRVMHTVTEHHRREGPQMSVHQLTLTCALCNGEYAASGDPIEAKRHWDNHTMSAGHRQYVGNWLRPLNRGVVDLSVSQPTSVNSSQSTVVGATAQHEQESVANSAAVVVHRIADAAIVNQIIQGPQATPLAESRPSITTCGEAPPSIEKSHLPPATPVVSAVDASTPILPDASSPTVTKAAAESRGQHLLCDVSVSTELTFGGTPERAANVIIVDNKSRDTDVNDEKRADEWRRRKDKLSVLRLLLHWHADGSCRSYTDWAVPAQRSRNARMWCTLKNAKSISNPFWSGPC